MICGQLATVYVGKGPERKMHTGLCMFDRGHDGNCVPPSLLNTEGVHVSSDQLADLNAILVDAMELDTLAVPNAERIQTALDLIASWKR